jgi:hypothetical protein
MDLPTITVFLTVVPPLWLLGILWRNKSHYHSGVPYFVGALLIVVARLLDIPFEVPSLHLTDMIGLPRDVADTAIVVAGDTADIIGISFLVAGFIQTIKSLKKAEDQVHALESFLPMCAWCKRIRDENNNWELIERYINKQGGSRVTHGVCPDCLAKLKEENPGLGIGIS